MKLQLSNYKNIYKYCSKYQKIYNIIYSIISNNTKIFTQVAKFFLYIRLLIGIENNNLFIISIIKTK